MLLFSDHSDEVVILDLEVLAQVLVISKHGVPNQQFIIYLYAIGFWARVHFAHPSFVLIETQNGALRAPPPPPLATSLFLPAIKTMYREIPAEITAENKINFFYIKNYNLPIPRPP